MKTILLLLLRFFQISRPFRPAACRFYPSCSSYAYGCLEKHGVCKGSLLTVWRLLRCHPFCAGGIEDVPEHFSWDVVRSVLIKRV